MTLLRKYLNIQIVSINGDFPWIPRLPDPSLTYFFLWGYLKSKVYTNSPHTTAVLKNNMQHEIAGISKETLKSVMESAKKECLLASK